MVVVSARRVRRFSRATKPFDVWRISRLVLIAWIACLVLQRFLSGVFPQHSPPFSPGERALILTAHPDDEVMFFAPTIMAMQAAGTTVFGLCLSTGNATGLGKHRALELAESYDILGVPAMRIASLDDNSLQDGMEVQWNASYISSLLERFIEQLDIDVILTFDSEGVTRHANHHACFEAVRLAAGNDKARASLGQTSPSHTLRILTLATVSPLWKFLGLPKALLDNVTLRAKHRYGLAQGSFHVLGAPSHYWTALQAMRKHQTQLVWFRYLYIIFSVYMRSNTLMQLTA
ncbi:LmbE-like protein [Tilletiaria anomala UBC 951]|uniref:N-acetylglucosaminylphosphatidylinositol deacetylase n=1 Tax=Tilletiaria anomala (strain ATCC 24038 / CBS 436.72 / UBC 951) TaxID=1037660 RepID=A0A066VYH8_TILAU|nr:LmbE-like protein [Tilletiaria anomala UBC 951]KDN46787.1 LmbE-like protein [Tilletiaria anomala UBC 951]